MGSGSTCVLYLLGASSGWSASCQLPGLLSLVALSFIISSVTYRIKFRYSTLADFENAAVLIPSPRLSWQPGKKGKKAILAVIQSRLLLWGICYITDCCPLPVPRVSDLVNLRIYLSNKLPGDAVGCGPTLRTTTITHYL